MRYCLFFVGIAWLNVLHAAEQDTQQQYLLEQLRAIGSTQETIIDYNLLRQTVGHKDPYIQHALLKVLYKMAIYAAERIEASEMEVDEFSINADEDKDELNAIQTAFLREFLYDLKPLNAGLGTSRGFTNLIYFIADLYPMDIMRFEVQALDPVSVTLTINPDNATVQCDMQVRQDDDDNVAVNLVSIEEQAIKHLAGLVYLLSRKIPNVVPTSMPDIYYDIFTKYYVNRAETVREYIDGEMHHNIKTHRQRTGKSLDRKALYDKCINSYKLYKKVSVINIPSEGF